jgi:hypothetical protein
MVAKSDPKIKIWEFFQTNMVYYYFSLQCESSPLKKTLIFTAFPMTPNMKQMIFFWCFGWSIIATFQPMFVKIGGNYDSQNV